MSPEPSAPSSQDDEAGFTVLVVDDNPIDRHVAGRMIERDLGWRVEYASDGREALAVLDSLRPNLILTDLFMPEVDGLELVVTVRQRFPFVPVVLMTGQGNEEIALRALQSGAASYVPKKRLGKNLVETLDKVATSAEMGLRKQQLLASMTETESSFILENDRTLVTPLVSLLQEMLSRMRLVDARDQVRVGVALEEALTNALYHGNLGVDSDLKDNDDALFARLAAERCREAPYRDRRIHVRARLTTSEAVISIRDEGAGFDPSKLPDPTDPQNLDRPSGRGLLLIRTFMDEVRHNPTGNQITMVKRRKTAP